MEQSPRSSMLSRRDRLRVNIRRESVSNFISSTREENIKWRLEKEAQNEPKEQSLTEQQLAHLLSKDPSLLDRQNIKNMHSFLERNPHREDMFEKYGTPLAKICLQHFKLEDSLQLMGTLAWKSEQLRSFLTARGAVRKCVQIFDETRDKTACRLIVWVLCSLAEDVVNFQPFVIVAQRYQLMLERTRGSSHFFMLLGRLACFPQLQPDSQRIMRELFHNASSARQLKRQIVLTALGQLALRMRASKIIPYLNEFLQVCNQLSFKKAENMRVLGRKVLTRLFEVAGDVVVESLVKSELIKNIIESTREGNVGEAVHNLRVIRVFFENLELIDPNIEVIDICLRQLTNRLMECSNQQIVKGCLIVIGQTLGKATTDTANLARLMISQYNMANVLEKVTYHSNMELSHISQTIYNEYFRGIVEY